VYGRGHDGSPPHSVRVADTLTEFWARKNTKPWYRFGSGQSAGFLEKRGQI
jgi:hypothetical protein